MKLEERMRLSIRRRTGNVVLRTDVAGLGSRSQVSHALEALQRKGELIRMGIGVYAKSTRDAATGMVHPFADFETLAREAWEKLGVSWRPSSIGSGHSEVSGVAMCAFVVDTGSRRISRKLSLGGRTVAYTCDRRRPASQVGTTGENKGGRWHLSVPTSDVGRFVQELARRYNVTYTRTPVDQWAETVTRLAGDEVRSGRVQDLLVALKRTGKISAEDMASLLVNYLREQKLRVRSV